MKKKIILILLGILLCGPGFVAVSGDIAFNKNWRTASRQSTGIAPDPATTPEAVVQVYSARAFNWRGIFGVHTWIATKQPGAKQYEVHQVIGWRLYQGVPVVVSEPDDPDRSWYGQVPEVIADLRGEQAAKLIPAIKAAVQSYPYADTYHVWPGPNSNTFTAWVARKIPELKIQLPATAIGKDFLPVTQAIESAPSGTGYQVSLFGLVGILLAKKEGFEINVLGLNFGIDFDQKAIIFPGLDRVTL
ncbi:MAG: DUF3750 domain-containing protein [Gammaproteobacteria bacterium]|nr:DUF3750 domain-containing protein [Gammaproteobacteria bacterium]